MTLIILSKKLKILLKSTMIQILPPFAIKKHCASLKPFIFPPGRQIQIKGFVCGIQEKYKNAGQKKLGQKHSLYKLLV